MIWYELVAAFSPLARSPPTAAHAATRHRVRTLSGSRTSVPPFANDGYGISRREQDYLGLMLAALIILPHLTVSSSMSLPKSAGEPASNVPPRSARFACILGSERLAL